MSETRYAVLQDEAGRAILRFERVLAHPPERVWRELNREYEERFGIPSEEATPPPK